MREILFRAKRIDNGEWVYGYYYYDAPYDEHIITFNDFSGGDGHVEPLYLMQVVAVDPETLGEYTGFKDKNDDEIYEGDLLEFYGYLGENYWIEISKDFEPPHNFFLGTLKKTNANIRGISDGIFTILKELPVGSKIIGNIHDWEE